MARFDEWDTKGIYATADQWRDQSLLTGVSLLWPGESVWTLENLAAFKKCFNDRPDESDEKFLPKFKQQLEDQPPQVTRLGCELLLLYFLFTSSVRGWKKRELIRTIAGWMKISVDEQSAPIRSLDYGIGGTGQAFNTRRPFEIAYLAEVAHRLVSADATERAALLADHRRVRDLLDEEEGDATHPMRHILLHLLYPDEYERIASGTHKRQIVKVFGELAGPGHDDADDKLLAIRRALEKQLPGQPLDFYRKPLRACWYGSGDSEAMQALTIKRQIVFHGPPGTGKTFEAKELAATLVRQHVLREWKAKRFFTEAESVEQLVRSRIRRVQLHPGYGYEDLVRGLHLVEQGTTAYRNGVLLQLIDQIAKQPANERDLPFVVILDEMNRADLSKVLGECFSLLEDREGRGPARGSGRDAVHAADAPDPVFRWDDEPDRPVA